MEVKRQPQHRTEGNSDAGRPEWVSMPRNTTPDIQSTRDGNRSGSGGKSCVLTRGGLFGSTFGGRVGSNVDTTPEEKSDHLIVVMKPGNAGGAKGVTG